ncbi:putative Rho GTPase activation protein [Helianthus annuus]|nr:putative Rho GTPase activation protein [Helianthus annuus]KAJ0815395.1 putative Rho GTPase activation protein [Helianthus annuus]
MSFYKWLLISHGLENGQLLSGMLDSLSPEQVIQCQPEDGRIALCRLQSPTETALLDWAINLNADAIQHEHLKKMNSHNIAMVFASNTTQASPRESQSDENSGQGLDCIHTCNKILMKVKRENMNSSLQMIIFKT